MPTFITACSICTFIVALLTVAHFNKRSSDWLIIKLTVDQMRRWWALLSWEAKKTIGIVLTVMLLLVGWMFS